jgi:hypothetical protein
MASSTVSLIVVAPYLIILQSRIIYSKKMVGERTRIPSDELMMICKSFFIDVVAYISAILEIGMRLYIKSILPIIIISSMNTGLHRGLYPALKVSFC